MALTDLLVAYWRMEGNSIDSAGINNGTDTAITYSSGNGKILQGAGFNGTTSKIQMPTNTFLNGKTKVTFNYWATFNDHLVGTLRATLGVQTNYVGAINVQYQSTNGSDQTIAFATAGTSPAVNPVNLGTITTGQWYMLTHTFDTVTLKTETFLNGTSVGSQTFSTLPAINVSTAFDIGRAYDTTRLHNGNLDEFGIWERVLTGSEITALYNGGTGLSLNPLATNLIAYYKAEGNANAEVGTNGTFTGASYATGKIGQGFDFTTSNYINCGDVYDIEYNQPYTKAFWIKTTDSTANKHLLSKQDSGTTFGPWIEINGGKIACWMYQSTSSIRRQTTNTYNDGAWHHVAVTYSGSGLGSGVIIYVDGASVATTSIGGTDTINQTMVNSTGFQINGRWNSTALTHTGLIDEIGIWDRVLTSADIIHLYNGGSGFSYPFNAPPVPVPTPGIQIEFDTFSSLPVFTNVTTGVPMVASWSHNNSGSFLLVSFLEFGLASAVKSATYNGVAMSAVGANSFCLLNPPIGNYTISVSLTYNSTYSGLSVGYVAGSWKNSKRTGQPIGATTSSNGTGFISSTIAVPSAGAWHIGTGFTYITGQFLSGGNSIVRGSVVVPNSSNMLGILDTGNASVFPGNNTIDVFNGTGQNFGVSLIDMMIEKLVISSNFAVFFH